jgi:hypothetical protein
MPILGQSMNLIVEENDHLKHVTKNELKPGDFIFVKTCNSLYKICKAEDGLYGISGDWFDPNSIYPYRLTIRGCSWCGSIIIISMTAAIGLCPEFSNNLVTSPVRKIILIKSNKLN